VCGDTRRVKLKQHWQILIALVMAVGVGVVVNLGCAVSREPTVELNATGQALVSFFDYLGTLFMLALKMIIVPLIFSSVVVGIAGLGKTRGFGRLGLKTVGYYALTSFCAILIGLTLVNLAKPGLRDGQPNPEIAEVIEANAEEYSAAASSKVADQQTSGLKSVADIFKRMIPENVVDAFSHNNKMLALIFVSLLTGFGILFVSAAARDSLLGFFRGLNELMLLVTGWIMLTAPVGVFGLVAETVALTGLEAFGLLAKYFLVVLCALLVHLLVVLPLILKFIGGVNPLRHFAAMRNALLTAFSTASSSATLPITMQCVRENVGASNRVTSFVLPLGATINMDGTALYECVAVMFIAQVLGMELGFAQQFLVVALALLTSVGVAGVPSASLVAILIIVNNVGIPNAEAVIGFLLAVDRPLDMSRTAVNVFSDSCGATVIARSEGEELPALR
jgi:Na+/H+-dicarboxylate symporter